MPGSGKGCGGTTAVGQNHAEGALRPSRDVASSKCATSEPAEMPRLRYPRGVTRFFRLPPPTGTRYGRGEGGGGGGGVRSHPPVT
jgi:hypothetical protein